MPTPSAQWLRDHWDQLEKKDKPYWISVDDDVQIIQGKGIKTAPSIESLLENLGSLEHKTIAFVPTEVMQ
jgi:hypothetical protein